MEALNATAVTLGTGIQVNHWWKSFKWQPDEIVGHAVPKEFRFPVRLSIMKLWDLWLFGNMRLGIRPYQNINKDYDLCEKDMRGPHVRAKRVMGFFMKLGESVMPEGATNFCELSFAQSDDMYDRVIEIALKMCIQITTKN